MPTFNPLLDPAPATRTDPAEPTQARAQEATAPESPNLFLGILGRWPWLVLGLAVGLVLGLLYHLQRPPVYQSASELLVIKNRPDMVAGSTGDVRVQYVEDYVGPQVILLGSETILKAAAEKFVDREGPYEVAPPPPAERVGFLKTRFAVVREKEPGSNTPSNVLLLTFKASHPADAPKYLRAVVAAYKASLSDVFEDASARQLEQLTAEVERLTAARGTTRTKLQEVERKLRGVVNPSDGKVLVPGISQEDPARVQQRVSDNRSSQTALTLRQIVIDKELDQIEKAGKSRTARLAVMARLNIPSDRPSIFGDVRDPDSMLAQLRYRKDELGVRLGPGHPDMITLNRQIAALEKELEQRGGPADDELERYRRKLENEKTALTAQLDVLAKAIDRDEETVRKTAPLQQEIRGYEDALRDQARDLQTAQRERDRVANSRTSGGYEVRDVSKPADGVQVAPVLVQSLLFGAVVGLLLGGGLGLRAELADRGFRSPADIRRRLGLPVLGHVPVIRTADPPEVQPAAALDPVLAVYLRPKSAEAEAIRGIRTQLLFSTRNKDHQVIQVTSPNAGDGKSTLAANLALALASADKRVVLVDCDFRKPRVHKLFALENPDVGLASVVADQSDLGGAVHGCEIDNLTLLPCGPRPSNPAELLTSPKFQEILGELRASYDFVILDTPPVLAVSDPAAVAPRADGVILVFRMTADAGPNAERAKEELAAVSARVLGVVVNASSDRDMGYGYGYAYKYDYRYSDSYADPGK